MKFLPDAPESTPGVLTDVEAVPTVRGYAGAPSNVSANYAALGATCTGAALCFKLDGSTRLFAGTQSNLYEGSGGSWNNRSRVGNYSTGDVRWSFAQFGNTSLAINKATVLQSSTSGAFADVANSPKAALMETVGAFVMLANCDDTGGLALYGDQPHRWWCSQSFNPTGTWSPSVSTLATTGLLTSSPGGIVALKRLGDQCVAYKNRAIHVGSYVGAPEVWTWSLVPGEIGARSNECVVSIGSAHLFVGYEDIYRFDGSRPVPIGAGIKEWFFSRLNKSYAYLIAGLHDYNTSTVWWWYPSSGSTTLDSVLIYNYQTDTWGHISSAISIPVFAQTTGITYETLGNFFNTYSDLPSISYDSPFWQGGAPVLSVIKADQYLYTITGTSTSSRLVTGYSGDPERYSLCDRVRVKYRTKPTTQTLIPYSVDELGDTIATGSATQNGDRFDLLQEARWHKFRLDFSGAVEVEAITPTLRPTGYE